MRIMADFEKLPTLTSPTTDTLIFTSKDLRVIRIVLRLMSLWRPRSAGFFESYVYPVFVNLVLLFVGVIRNSIQAAVKEKLLNIQLLYTVHEVVVWLGHILGNRYFASRDLETNVLSPVRTLTGITQRLNRWLKVLNTAVIISVTFFSVMLCGLYVVTQLEWNKGAQRFSADLSFLHAPLDHVVYGFVILSIVYDLGVALALVWALALLYSCYEARLKILENIFLKWKHSSVNAVSFFLELYARPVRNSWKRISGWFLAHNIVALAIPLYGYELAQAVSGQAYHSKHLPVFICYLVYIVTIWLAPIVMAEQIKRREKKFLERINDISPCLPEREMGTHSLGESEVHPIDENGVHTHPVSSDNDSPLDPRQTTSLGFIGSTSTEESDNGYTFLYRSKELKHFVRFLKQRTPGLVSGGYSFQLNMSFFSLLVGAISFLTELHTMNDDVVHRNCNCTMS